MTFFNSLVFAIFAALSTDGPHYIGSPNTDSTFFTSTNKTKASIGLAGSRRFVRTDLRVSAVTAAYLFTQKDEFFAEHGNNALLCLFCA